MFFQQLINGLTTGSVYALVALGYTMIYGILGLINFAQGEIYMCGAFVTVLLLATGQVNFYRTPFYIYSLIHEAIPQLPLILD